VEDMQRELAMWQMRGERDDRKRAGSVGNNMKRAGSLEDNTKRCEC
jgi:hypothetical protein